MPCQTLTHPHGAANSRTVEIRPAEGGVDAQLFCRQLFDAMLSWATLNGVRTADVTQTTHGCAFTATPGARLERFGGVHRIQRIPEHDQKSRRHTSTVTVAVLDDSTRRDDNLLNMDDVVVEWFSGTGAGGQHRNRHRNCCRLRHLPSGFVVVGTAQRQQQRNFDDALEELTRRINQTADGRRNEDLNTTRSTFVATDTVERTWVWNTQRDQVTHVPSGTSGSLKKALRGKFPDTSPIC